MNPDTGGLSSEERQRLTATEIARKKVLESYSNNIFSSTKSLQQLSENSNSQTTPTNYKSSPLSTNFDLSKYHSAWQNYYQKYYNDYYTKAAKQYVESERQKIINSKPDESKTNSSFNAHILNPEATDNTTIISTLRENIQKKANSRFKLKRHSKHLPLFLGIFVVLFLLFLQYNRLIFAPIMAYIAPGNNKGNNITAIDPTVSIAVSDQNKLMIPKLNIDVPVHFGISNDTKTINDAMNNGVAHFAIPGAEAFPGQIGNTVITGHSAGDIYSFNQYKFIFSGLERLVEGDLIYIDYNKTRYTYKLTKKETVEPSNVDALIYDTKKPMLTLITCWPLGTTRYRLLVTAEQISPIPNTITETSSKTATENTKTELPKNESSFFEKIWNFLVGK